MQSIEPAELKDKMSKGEDLLLIDVREPFEHEAFNIGGTLIPMSQLVERLDEIPADKPVILYCQKGIRSVIAIQRLQQRGKYNNLINLAGGMDNWMKQFNY